MSPWRLALVLAAVAAVSIPLGLPLITAVLLLALGVVAAGVLSPSDARRAVDLDVIVTIAAAFGLAAAISNSGLADQISDLAVRVVGSDRPIGVLIGIVLATTILKELVTTNAAALLMFPIADQQRTRRGRRPAGLRDRRRRSRIQIVPDPDRLPDQHHGLRSGRLPLLRLRPPRAFRSRWLWQP